MDLEALKYLSDEDKTRYMVLERLFTQPGWELVVALTRQLALEAKDRAAFASSWDANRVAVGNGLAYDHISRLQDNTEAEYQQKADSAKEQLALVDEEQYE